jgi:hypothetical protein
VEVPQTFQGALAPQARPVKEMQVEMATQTQTPITAEAEAAVPQQVVVQEFLIKALTVAMAPLVQ